MPEMTDRERAAELLWQRDEARAKLVRVQNDNERLELELAYCKEALRAEIERANAAERAAQRR